MKKYLLSLIVLLIFPVVAFAAPKVLTVDSKADGYKISYTGTAEDGVTAVMCKVLDEEDNEVDMLSSAVDKNKFEGEFEVTVSGDYKVACAKYEGGAIVTSKVTVDVNTDDIDNAKTFDAGITTSLILLAVSSIGIAAVLVVKKKSKKASK